MSRTVIKKVYSTNYDEQVSNTVLIPGMLVKRLSNGKIDIHSQAGGPVFPMFAVEDELQGKAIGDNYAADDRVKLVIPWRGDQIYAIADDNASGAIAVGDFVESSGDGRLRKHSQANTGTFEFPNVIVGRALEAVTPGPGTLRFLIEVF